MIHTSKYAIKIVLKNEETYSAELGLSNLDLRKVREVFLEKLMPNLYCTVDSIGSVSVSLRHCVQHPIQPLRQ